MIDAGSKCRPQISINDACRCDTTAYYCNKAGVISAAGYMKHTALVYAFYNRNSANVQKVAMFESLR